jgi:hypothetical protein
MNAMAYALKASAPSAASVPKIGRPDDAFEQEADRAADQVMSGAGTAAQWSLSRMSIAPLLQRKCSCGGGKEECKECKAKGALQRKASGPAEMSHAPVIVHDVLRSSGTPLDGAARSFFEPRFGHDFSRVRIHSGGQAAASAHAVQADAYTVGAHIVLGRGTYSHTERQRLIAHELSHVVQQNSAQPLLQPGSSAAGTWAPGGSQEMPLSRINSSAPLQRQTTDPSSDTPPPIGRDFELAPHVIPMNAQAVPEKEKCEQFPGGSTDCEVNEQTGIPTGKVTHRIDETNPCTRPCVEAHENVHVQQLRTFCPALRDCYRASDAGKRPALDCFKMAVDNSAKRECAAYQVSVPCVENRMRTAKECQSKENKEFVTRKLASEKCFRNMYCSADTKPEKKQGSK